MCFKILNFFRRNSSQSFSQAIYFRRKQAIFNKGSLFYSHCYGVHLPNDTLLIAFENSVLAYPKRERYYCVVHLHDKVTPSTEGIVAWRVISKQILRRP
jgi:hypothetical protein